MFNYELKKLISKKFLCFIPVLSVYIFMDFWYVQEENLWGENPYIQWFLNYKSDIKIIFLILIFLLSPVFSREKELDMFDMIVVSRRGVTDLPKVKLAVSLVMANLLLLMYGILTYVGFGMGRAIWDWNIRIDDPLMYKFVSNANIVTYKDLLYQVWFNSFLSINLTVLLILFISSKCKQTVGTAVAAFVINFVFGASALIKVMGISVGAYIVISLPVNLIWNDELNMESVLLARWRVQAIYAVQMLYVLIGIVLFGLIYIAYKHRR